eukprot:scaffold5597_cov105-Isochrysis_galbana.AAC.2
MLPRVLLALLVRVPVQGDARAPAVRPTHLNPPLDTRTRGATATDIAPSTAARPAATAVPRLAGCRRVGPAGVLVEAQHVERVPLQRAPGRPGRISPKGHAALALDQTDRLLHERAAVGGRRDDAGPGARRGTGARGRAQDPAVRRRDQQRRVWAGAVVRAARNVVRLCSVHLAEPSEAEGWGTAGAVNQAQRQPQRSLALTPVEQRDVGDEPHHPARRCLVWRKPHQRTYAASKGQPAAHCSGREESWCQPSVELGGD